MTREISYSDISKYLNYDSLTGIITWKESRGRVRAGQRAGVLKSDSGYIAIRVQGYSYYAHRLAWVMANKSKIPDGMEIDHINGVRHDNRIANLRLATSTENSRNMAIPTHNTSGISGVTYRKNRGTWQAQISIGNVTKYIGSFSGFEEAVSARQAAEKAVFGEFIPNGRKV